MQRSSYAALAVAIVIVGAGGAALPGLIDASDPVGYLRGASHGRKSTTTLLGHPGRVAEHRWSNEAPPPIADPIQMPPTIPESGGRPTEAP